MNKKGFTLIEIIAVVVILGVIMFIAVPSVSTYILGSRKDTYISDANRFVSGAKTVVETKEIVVNKKDITYYIPKECLAVDKAENSPYGKWDKVYVIVTYDNNKYNYYFTSIDSEKMGMKLTYSEDFSADKVTKIDNVTTMISIGKNADGTCIRSKIRILNDDCSINGSTLLEGITNCINDKESVE